MHADAHFVIGQAHVNGGKPCQDYAIAGDLANDGAYAIIADGCSSGARTDVGARIIALSTERELRREVYLDTTAGLEAAVTLRQQQNIQLASALFGLQTADMLTTCGYIFANPQRRFIWLQGDGVIAYQLLDGTFCTARIDWADNLPAYAAYGQDEYRQFMAAHGDDPRALKVTISWHRFADNTWQPVANQELSVAAAMHGLAFPLPADARVAALFTDGATQVSGTSWPEVARQLTAFKTMTGEFAKRRLNRSVKDWSRTSHGPIDDLAYAVINLLPQES